MADAPIDLAQHRNRQKGDGFGALLFTVYHYEDGHVVHVPDEQLPADRFSVWDKMFRTLWYEAEGTFKETGSTDYELVILTALTTSGRRVTFTNEDQLTGLEQIFWLQRQLKRIGQEDIPSFTCRHANNNQPQGA